MNVFNEEGWNSGRLNQREEKGENDGLFCQGGGVFHYSDGTPLGPRQAADGRFFGTRWVVVPTANPTQPADSTMRL